jgi:hypothetical protein
MDGVNTFNLLENEMFNKFDKETHNRVAIESGEKGYLDGDLYQFADFSNISNYTLEKHEKDDIKEFELKQEFTAALEGDLDEFGEFDDFDDFAEFGNDGFTDTNNLDTLQPNIVQQAPTDINLAKQLVRFNEKTNS